MNGAIQRLDAGDADILLAVRLDRLTRSNQDLLTLMDRSASNGWSMATTDRALDTSTAMGRAMAKMASVFAELERELIGERTKAGMAQRKLEGQHIGRRSSLPPDVILRVKALAAEGLPYPNIAHSLMSDGTVTASGTSNWTHAAVRSAVRANPSPPPTHAQREAAELLSRAGPMTNGG